MSAKLFTLCLYLVCTYVVCTYLPACAWAQPESKYALLIGVTKYSHAEMNRPQLEYPEIDARSVGKFLDEHGYKVEYLLGSQATKLAIESKLAGLANQGDEDGAVIVGLWGHGVEYEGSDEAMFCPYDAKIRIAKDADGKTLFDRTGNKELLEPDPATLVGMSRILTGLRLTGAGSRLLLADCCRESPTGLLR